MADLSTMFNQLGPAGGSILAGVQMGNEANAARSEQAMRQAQMDKILMETDQAKLMNPLELQAKQQTIASADLKAKQEKEAYRDEVLGKAIPTLAGISGPARYAAAEQLFAQAGIPLDQADKQHLFGMSPDAMLKELKAKHEWSLTQNKGYRQAMDVAQEQGKWHKYSADSSASAQRYAADVRGQIARERASAEKTLSQDLSGAHTLEAQQAVYNKHAAMAKQRADDLEYTRLNGLAQQAELQNLQRIAASATASQEAKTNAQMRMMQILQTGTIPGADPMNNQSVIVKPPSASTGQTKSGAKYTIETTP
ncbi:hypothetical protein UFOVP128_31 [uncultured Caudovirales phage]|uniref:Uncharacterized protein n=1 Tax=uncultured Caudovirales phage TaxID=2100421 RepID=A0A6J7X0Z8_9CAUD|nr:hypothetical protein UFOVP128_31 [uncultured Caudovirales phage]CAB5222044.1 hypothetical protein UFOVP243_13 [uncultured Caudovirales phage]